MAAHQLRRPIERVCALGSISRLQPSTLVRRRSTNDLYEDRVYLNIPNYHYCSVRIEWSARSTTFHPDPNAVQSDTGRSVKLLNGPAAW